MLHTPLMSGTNAIHGIILFGGMLVLAGRGRRRWRRRSALSRWFSVPPTCSAASWSPTGCCKCSRKRKNELDHRPHLHRRRGFVHPRHQVFEFAEDRARRAIWWPPAACWSRLLALHKTGGTDVWSQGWTFNYTLIVVGIVIGLVIGAIGAYSVKMTAMPQMVALFNGLGGGAAALVASLEFLHGAQQPRSITASIASSDAVRHAHRLAVVFRQHHRVSEAGGKILKSRTRSRARTF